MATVSYEQAIRHYAGTSYLAVEGLDLEVGDGEFLMLVGPSGYGKSTSLRMLAGLEEVDSGGVHIGNREVTHLWPKDRNIATVFQNYALCPHVTVAQNMGFSLKIARTVQGEITRRGPRQPSCWISKHFWNVSPSRCQVVSVSAWQWGVPSSVHRRCS